jgi:hypothetical protein
MSTRPWAELHEADPELALELALELAKKLPTAEIDQVYNQVDGYEDE